MFLLRVYANAACPYPRNRDVDMLYKHRYVAWYMGMQHGHAYAAWTWTRSKYWDMQHVLAHADVHVRVALHVHAACLSPCCVSMLHRLEHGALT
jgi:hypothetical protein